VHALHQVAAAVAPREREPAALLRGLWGRLPPDLSCLEARPAPLDFDPRRWALGKLYRYRILRRRAPCPFRQGHCWRHALPLDLAAMREAAALLVGRHDFAAFRAAGCSARSTIRPLTHLRLIEQEEELWIEVEGNGFLRHQVRIIAGSLVEVGEGRRSPDSLRRALQEGRRELAGRTAPAEGLWLVRVDMGEGPRTGDTTEEEG
jgi:tRNA pseudouridine38-40 synthase